MDRRGMLRLMASAGVAGAAVPVLAGCDSISSGGGSRNNKPLKLGALLPQSGVYKSIGDDMTNGLELYLDLHNHRLGGRPVELIYADEGDTASTGKDGANKLVVEQQVHALTGVASSITMANIKDMVEKAQIPLLGSNASPVSLPGVKYIWRTSYVNDDAGRALGRYLARQVNGRFYAIAADYLAGHDEVNGFLDAFKEGGGKLAVDPDFVAAPPKTPDFTSSLANIKRSGATAVYAFFAGQQAEAFVRSYHQSRLTLPVFAPGFLTEGSALLKKQGDAAKGMYTSLNYSADLDNAANRTFATAYEKKYDALPTTYAMASYDAAAVLDKAVQIAGSDSTSQALNSAIGRVGQIDSPRGVWQFNQNRTPQQKWYLRKVVTDGTVLSNIVVRELITLG